VPGVVPAVNDVTVAAGLGVVVGVVGVVPTSPMRLTRWRVVA
jgi:hypothetical protein